MARWIMYCATRTSPRIEIRGFQGVDTRGFQESGALHEGRSEGAMRVIKISPRGYCYGVVDAIQMAKRVARDPGVPRPIYVLGQIVHNRHAVEGLSALGIVT